MTTMSILERTVHAAVAVTVLSLVVMQFDGTLFSYHPTAMSIGFLALMTEGVLSALRFRRLEGQQRVAAIQTHLYIQAVATVAVTLGFVAIARNKVRLTRGSRRDFSEDADPAANGLLLSVMISGPVAGRRSCMGRHTSRPFMERCAPPSSAAHLPFSTTGSRPDALACRQG